MVHTDNKLSTKEQIIYELDKLSERNLYRLLTFAKGLKKNDSNKAYCKNANTSKTDNLISNIEGGLRDALESLVELEEVISL